MVSVSYIHHFHASSRSVVAARIVSESIALAVMVILYPLILYQFAYQQKVDSHSLTRSTIVTFTAAFIFVVFVFVEEIARSSPRQCEFFPLADALAYGFFWFNILLFYTFRLQASFKQSIFAYTKTRIWIIRGSFGAIFVGYCILMGLAQTGEPILVVWGRTYSICYSTYSLPVATYVVQALLLLCSLFCLLMFVRTLWDIEEMIREGDMANVDVTKYARIIRKETVLVSLIFASSFIVGFGKLFYRPLSAFICLDVAFTSVCLTLMFKFNQGAIVKCHGENCDQCYGHKCWCFIAMERQMAEVYKSRRTLSRIGSADVDEENVESPEKETENSPLLSTSR